MSVFDSFDRKHDFLVCVDSDGCVMDTMSCKHFHCFGPCVVSVWGLERWRVPILERWNQMNLFRMTRGIDRFRALAAVLSEVDERNTPIAGLEALRAWVENAEALSDEGLKAAIAETPEGEGRQCLEQALAWSRAVDISVGQLPDELKQPFAGAKEGLAAAHDLADVAVLSDPGWESTAEEWSRHGLLEHTDVLLDRDKAHSIAWLLSFGYPPDHVLMVGDAPGDHEAAEMNGVWFYPILVSREAESWQELKDVALEKLRGLDYADYQPEKDRQFLTSLGGA